MLIVYSGQANELNLKAVAKASGDAITAGTVNFYLKATTGTNAGKWYRGSDGTWQASESIAGAGTHVSDGDWKLSLASAVWTSHVAYRAYVVESGDLHVPNGDDILCAPYGGSIVSGSGPLTRAVLKEHLGVTHTRHDDMIDQLQLAATLFCEQWHNRIYVTREVVEVFDRFPAVFRPRRGPLVSVTSIGYVDTDGNDQTVNSSVYDVDTTTEPGRIARAYGQSWPTPRSQIAAVTLTYDAGYGQAADVPDTVKAAIKLMVAYLYEHREASGTDLPGPVRNLLGPSRMFCIDSKERNS
jgi:uncharacterized phiE125 gp8 family phage protein